MAMVPLLHMIVVCIAAAARVRVTAVCVEQTRQVQLFLAGLHCDSQQPVSVPGGEHCILLQTAQLPDVASCKVCLVGVLMSA